MAVPESIQRLFSLDRKQEVERYLHDLVVTKAEFAETVLECRGIGYRHYLRNYEYIPEDIKRKVPRVRELLRNARAGDKVGEAVGIIRSVFEARTLGVAHLFENADRWHVFHFTHRDISDEDVNHWEHGPHLHFVNFLWPNLSKENVWDCLGQKGNRPPGLHARFIDDPAT